MNPVKDRNHAVCKSALKKSSIWYWEDTKITQAFLNARYL
jgi:hypothetical protein